MTQMTPVKRGRVFLRVIIRVIYFFLLVTTRPANHPRHSSHSGFKFHISGFILPASSRQPSSLPAYGTCRRFLRHDRLPDGIRFTGCLPRQSADPATSWRSQTSRHHVSGRTPSGCLLLQATLRGVVCLNANRFSSGQSPEFTGLLPKNDSAATLTGLATEGPANIA